MMTEEQFRRIEFLLQLINFKLGWISVLLGGIFGTALGSLL